MKRVNQSYRKQLDQFFEPSQKISADIEPALERLLDRRADNMEGVFEGLEVPANSIRMKPPLSAKRRLWTVAAAAALVVTAVWIGLGWQARGVYARLETADGSVSRISEGKAIPVRVGERIEAQEIVRSGSEGSTLVLADGSRVEMRAQSELVLERADDGVRIRLNKGDVIVNAAKQHGHLYVQTRDLNVSVVGTVFLVNADDEGSRVAVIEGEVRVQQGTVEKSLRPGEQLASDPRAENLQFFRETGWSREAFAYLSKLHESMARQSPERATSVSDKPKFEEASIRPCEQDIPGVGGRGTSSGAGGSNSIRLTPGRVDALCMDVATLIATAYRSLNNNPGILFSPSCCTLKMNSTFALPEDGGEDGTRVRGGPSWVRSEKYTIAAIGDSTDAPTLQGPMLLDLLGRRFNLKLRVETEEIPVYALTIAKGGLKMKPLEVESVKYEQLRKLRASWNLSRRSRQEGPDPKELDKLATYSDMLGCSFLPPQASRDDTNRFLEAVRRGVKPPECALGSIIRAYGPNQLITNGGSPISSLVDALRKVTSPLAPSLPPNSLSDTLNGLLVVDQTDLPDINCLIDNPPAGTPCAPLFNIVVEFAVDESFFTSLEKNGVTPAQMGLDMNLPKAPNIFNAVEKLGLHLEKSKAPREFILIEHIERPSPN